MNFDKLIKFWKSQGLSKTAGATEEQIQEFECEYQIKICREFRSYLATANGMAEEDNCDSNIFAFWPLARIKPIREECPGLEGTEGRGNYFVFADYMIWSWAYAVNLDASQPNAGEVILVGGLRPQCIAGSFHEFISLYIEDSRHIYAASRF